MRKTFTQRFMMLLSSILFACAAMVSLNASAQLAECKDKYLGNIVGSYVPLNYTQLWNGVTAENDCKWGVIESTRDQMNWTGADRAYNLAQQNGYEFRWHAIAWGSQYPAWFENLSESESKAEIIEYMEAVATRYPNIDQIDVLNENINFDNGNPHADGTRYFRNQLGGAGETGYDWIVWLFTEARRIFPNSELIINDYGLVNDPSAIRRQLEIIDVLTERNLVDGFGSQSHEFNINTLSAQNLKSNLDLMATGGIPLYITELDISGNDQEQLERYERLFPVYWEHPNVAGVSIWGYVFGETWKDNTGLIRDGQDRPAMTWLRQYMDNLPDVCNVEGAPDVEITAPSATATFEEGDDITIEATAIDEDGSVTNVEFFVNGVSVGNDDAAPFSYEWNDVSGGNYRITVQATDNEGNVSTSTAVNILVLGNIVIYANGTAGTETVELIVDGDVLTNWTLEEGWGYYTYTGPSFGTFQINYTNDADGRDVQLDYLEVDGVIYEAEDQQVNTGSYDNDACGGGEYTEYMYCSGYVEFVIEAPDTDEDGTPDSEDACPNDPDKTETAGVCGCGNVDEDIDNDDVCDSEDDFIDVDEDGVAQENDCDDNDENVGVATVWYEDIDGDGLGSSVTTEACDLPDGYVAEGGDNNDNDADNDGVETSEDCDDTDENVGAGLIWYQDLDDDELGNSEVTLVACDQPDGYVGVAGDNNDNDADNDGISTSEDCDDTDENVGAGTVWYEDADGDGNGDQFSTVTACEQPDGYVAEAGDDCPNDINKTEPGYCGCGNTEESCEDCAGTPNGEAEEDVCGTCAGGTTGLVPVTDPDACITSASEEVYLEEFNMYPNPTSGIINLTNEAEWELYSAQGSFITHGKTAVINISDQRSGIYFIKAEGRVFKIVKD